MTSLLRNESLDRSYIFTLRRNPFQQFKCISPHFAHALVIPKEILCGWGCDDCNNAQARILPRTDFSGPGSVFVVILDDRKPLRPKQASLLFLVQKPYLVILWKTLQFAVYRKSEYLAQWCRIGQRLTGARMGDLNFLPEPSLVGRGYQRNDAGGDEAPDDPCYPCHSISLSMSQYFRTAP